MQTFHDRFRQLSDESLLQRINRKEHYRKEAVLAAYHVLCRRGYDLENPFPEVTSTDQRCSDSSIKPSFQKREYHVGYKMISKKKPIGLLVLYFLLFFPVVWYSNSYFNETLLYRKIHLFTQTVISHGAITYILEIVLIFAFFINSRNSWNNFLKVKSNLVFVAVKVFIFSLIVISAWEWLFSNNVTIAMIAENKTNRELLKSFWYGGLVAFTEEVIFKWLLLSQLLIRAGDSSGNRRLVFLIVSILFAVSHIPIQITEYGGTSTGHLFKVFLYSYFTSILYVKHRNFPLVVLIHFFVNISHVFIDDGKAFYSNWAIVLLGIYCIPKINNSWLFRSHLKLRIPKWAFASVVAIVTLVILLSARQPKDLYNYSRQYYFMDSYVPAMNLINKAISGERHNAEFFNHRGNIYYSLEKYDSAWFDYDQAVKIDSSLLGAIRNRGLAAKHLSMYHECINDLTVAITNKIRSSNVYQNRGCCYIEIGELELAISDFERVLKRDSSNDQAYYGLGRAYLKLTDFKRAATNFELAIYLDPKFIEAYEGLAMSYSGQGKYDSSNAVMTKAIEMGSLSPLRFYVRGVNYYKKEDYYNAIKEFEKSIEFNPEEPALFLYLAYSYFFLENYEKGCEYLNTSASLGSEQANEDLDVYCEKTYNRR